jgi:hypothetical protein
MARGMTLFAHAGHRSVSLLCALPVVVIVGGLWWTGRREGVDATGREREG